ncbi:MAG TPA: UDP-N-acetylmuramyl-tripeptide synthetase [Candidatus Paceibacterota bacterium]|nr:UDP-N-acetylmuramyl-tripeptide synthetase [Candidatus Paceibacterota bacterium]
MNPSNILEKTLRRAKRLIPKSLFRAAQPFYHYALAILGALRYGFPSKKLMVIGVTGTKGKSTTVELVNSILEAAGYKTAVAGTIRFKIGDDSRRNMYKMTMPGRFFLQSFLARAVKAGCTHAVIEMTSEGSKQYRYRFVYPDALIFTNLSPEHIESHGSYEKYVEAKLDIARRVLRSGKPRRILVANGDDKETPKFLGLGIPESLTYFLSATPHVSSESGSTFTFMGTEMRTPLPGEFNLANALGAATLAQALGIDTAAIALGIKNLAHVPGRAETVTLAEDHELAREQDFTVVVDYAHTPDSLKAIYGAYGAHRKICVLGSTGGGRDTWKRGAMGAIADEYCDEIILTDEDPYDEDPQKIVADVAEGIKSKKPDMLMDRREAIHAALSRARKGDAVLITGKGTDPYIMGKNGAKQPWSDANIAREELEKVLKSRASQQKSEPQE